MVNKKTNFATGVRRVDGKTIYITNVNSPDSTLEVNSSQRS